MSVTLSTELGGRTLTIETGRLARLAGGSVTVRYGDTMVLGTANRSDPRPGLDFFPLTVEFEERMYAAGKIPGGFIKRESRAVGGRHPGGPPDRPAHPAALPRGLQGRRPARHHRPLDRPGERPRHPRHDRRVGRADASARSRSSAPSAPSAIGRIDGEFVVNPTFSQLAESELDLVVSGTRDAIMMVEAGAKLLPEDVMAEAIMFGHRALQPLVDLQEQLAEGVGKAKRMPFIEPGTGSVLDFAKAAEARWRVRRLRRRDHQPRPQDGRPRRDRRGPGQGRQDRRPLVDPGQPRPAHHRQPDARHHRRRRGQGPDAGGGRQGGPRLHR